VLAQVRRPEPNRVAMADAARLEAEQGAASPLGLTIKVLLIGLTGSGKSELINSLLDQQVRARGAPSAGVRPPPHQALSPPRERPAPCPLPPAPLPPL
jgi:septin family protein